jgi:L-arabinose isomerase
VLPSILWASTPYEAPPKKSTIMDLFVNSGIVGTFEAFGVLKRASPSRAPLFVMGSSRDEKPYQDILRIARAACVRKALRTSRLAILPYRNPQMIVTYVDEFALARTVGPAVEYVSARELKKAADSISGSAVSEYTRRIASECLLDPRVTQPNLAASARASLGMEKLLFDRELDGLALSDLNPELHEVMGLRPCLYPERLARSEKVVGNEGDLGGTTAMLILRKLTGRPVMFTEIFNFDLGSNTVLAGHAGPANALLSDESTRVSITPDYELMDSPSGIGGVWMEFIARPGRVTLVNFFQCPPGGFGTRSGAPEPQSGGFAMTVVGGESLGGDLRIEGYPHAAVRLDPPLPVFLESCATHGTSHHWAIVHKDVRTEMRHFGRMLGIPTTVVE